MIKVVPYEEWPIEDRIFQWFYNKFFHIGTLYYLTIDGKRVPIAQEVEEEEN